MSINGIYDMDAGRNLVKASLEGFRKETILEELNLYLLQASNDSFKKA